MEEMKKMSLLISRKLDESYSEEEISLRRHFLNYMHALYMLAFTRAHSPKMDLKMSGSVMEGFNPLRLSAMMHEMEDYIIEVPPTGSDVDIMCVLDKLEATPSAKSASKDGILKLEFSEQNPGYAQLTATQNDIQIMQDILSFLGPLSNYTEKKTDSLFIVSSEKFLAEFYRYLESSGYANIGDFGKSVSRMMGGNMEACRGPYKHGPAATNAMIMMFGIASETNIMEYDLVPAIRVSVWPEVAKGWSGRIRKWPDESLEKQIIQAGCHIVPVGNEQSKYKTTEWRLSFSAAEEMLIHSWNSTQQKCYILLKAICYHHLRHEKGLKTYHLKTSMFWACEREAPNFWTEENLIGCLRQVLVDLRECCKSQKLLHYFVIGNNLLEPIEETALCNVVAKIDKILFEGLAKIVLSNPYIFSKKLGENVLENVTQDMTEREQSSRRMNILLQYNLKDWDFVCAQVIYGSKEQLYTGNATETIKNLKTELERADAVDISSESHTHMTQFMKNLYKQVLTENIGWLLLVQEAFEIEDRKEQTMKEAQSYMKVSVQSGSRSALAKYAYLLYKCGNYAQSSKLCGTLVHSSDDQDNGMNGNIQRRDLVDSFDRMVSEHVPVTDVVFKGEDHYAFDEPMKSMVAAAPHFFSLRPRAFAYIVLALNYYRQKDHAGLQLTLEEYSWYAKRRPTDLLKGKELVTLAVLYHHFGMIPEAVIASDEAARLDQRFSQVARHISTRSKSELARNMAGWIRGVIFSTFVAHSLHYIGAEWILNWADSHF